MTHCEMLKTNHKFLYNFFLVYLDKAVIRKKKQLGGGGEGCEQFSGKRYG